MICERTMNFNNFFFNFYLFMIVTQREREAETQAEGEAGSLQGARCGIRSRISRIAPWAKGRRQTAAPPRDPRTFILGHPLNGSEVLVFASFSALQPFLASPLLKP